MIINKLYCSLLYCSRTPPGLRPKTLELQLTTDNKLNTNVFVLLLYDVNYLGLFYNKQQESIELLSNTLQIFPHSLKKSPVT